MNPLAVKDQSVERLGLYGGSFDPVHNGHLLVARTALEELALDRLFLIPAARSPFKPAQVPTPPAVRARLLRLAFAGWNRCQLDLQEIERGGVSYTIDTLRAYRRQHPAARLFYLIGADHLASLPQWREAEALAEVAEFVVVPRPGESVTAVPAAFRIRQLTGFPLALSASQIRERVQQGRPIDHLAPPAVTEAIRNNGLYLRADLPHPDGDGFA